MRRFAILVIASVLAPGLASVLTRPALDIATLPGEFVPDTPVLRPELIPEVSIPIQNLPSFIEPDVEVEIEAHPMPTAPVLSPCDVCFEYMTELINQLTVGSEVPAHPELPEVGLPEPELPEVGLPMPETIPEDLRPLPLPVAPEVEINPIPIPVAPEVDIRPLPLPVAPEVEIQPIPLPVAQLIRPAF